MNIKIALILVVLMALVVLPHELRPASAHVVKNFGDVTIKVALATEPPLLGDTNAIQIFVSQGTGNNTQPLADTALDNADVSLKYGGVTKAASFIPSDDTPGEYGYTFIPSNLGSYFVLIKGTVGGQAVDASFPLDEVEAKDKYLFPQSSVQGVATSGGSDTVGPKVNEIINQISRDINDVKASTNQTANVVLEAQKSYQDLKNTTDALFIVSGIGIGVGVAGITIAVFAINRSKHSQ
ncbi:MAG: hypothetical protein KGH88_01390 [Thaumarchaeota archaeon]|nr:hypothetical protein [Nitrososphaerota archaeon]